MTNSTSDGASNCGRKYRMAAIDLDGTLLDNEHNLSEKAVQYLRYLHSKGFIVSIATGRVFPCVEEHVLRLNLPFASEKDFEEKKEESVPELRRLDTTSTQSSITTQEDKNNTNNDSDNGKSFVHRRYGLPVVCSNGAICLQAKCIPSLPQPTVTTRPLFANPVPRDIVLKVLEFSQSSGHLLQYYYGNEIYIYPDTKNEENYQRHLKLAQEYAELTQHTQKHVSDAFTALLEQGLPSKLLLLCGVDHIDKVLTQLHTLLGSKEATIIRGSPTPFFAEVLHPEVTKGQGVKQMCQTLQVPLEEVVGFGDGENDVEMMERVGWSVAMKNATGRLKGVVKEVSEWSNQENGVIQTLQRMEADGLLYFPADEEAQKEVASR